MTPTNKQLEERIKSVETNTKEKIDWWEKNLKSYVEHNSTAPATDSRLTALETDMKNRITFKQFYWVIGIMMTILMTTVGYLIDQIHEVQSNQYEVAREVSSIDASLEYLRDSFEYRSEPSSN